MQHGLKETSQGEHMALETRLHGSHNPCLQRLGWVAQKDGEFWMDCMDWKACICEGPKVKLSHISLYQNSFPSCSSPRVMGLGARKWWFWRDMISLADSLPFGYQWKMNTLRVLKKWLELELVVLEVECGRGIQIVLPQCGNITRERGLQALLTWVLVITYTLHVFCACFRRKKRIKNAILKWFTDSFSSTVPCAPQHVLPAILMHTWNS